jgi:hypothetical protein
MLKSTELREAAYGWMKAQPSGSHFGHADAYKFLELSFPDECSQRGDAAHEPRYKNDARWAAQDALRDQIIKKTAIRGRFQRV